MFKLIKSANGMKINNIKPFAETVGIIGAPFCLGQDKKGVEEAPDAMRQIGLFKELETLGVKAKDYGNLQFETELGPPQGGPYGIMKRQMEVGKACEKMSAEVKKVLGENRMCITIGGDHSLGVGTVHGHSEVTDVCVLWVDAHADINTPNTTLSGLFHGLPCSFFVEDLKKYVPEKMAGFEWVTPRVKKANLAYIALRDIDPLEKLLLVKEDIVHFTMSEVDRFGIRECTQKAINAINPSNKLSLHVSFDIDAIDKLVVPCTGTPVLGGLTMREAQMMAEEISQLENFRALDVMEINPSLGNDYQKKNTLQAGKLLIRHFLGHTRAGSLPPEVKEVPMPGDPIQEDQGTDAQRENM